MKRESYLSERGKVIFDAIYDHCKRKGFADDIDTFELSMLANSFDLYAKMAKDCNGKKGVAQVTQSKYSQVRAEYTVMRNEYQNILKHSPKFGLNPSDREKLTRLAKQPEEEEEFEDL